MRLGVSIELSSLVGEVEVDGVGPCECEEDQGNAHGVPGADPVRHVAQDDRNDRTTANRRNQERRTPLGVTTKSAKSQGKDNWEDAGLEE
jgi:hypothetical protein